MNKSDQAYKTIGEVVKILDLKNRSGQKTPTHTIRYWEKEFKQVKPSIFSGKRRYYDYKTIDILKKIQYLLKDKGMTINGVKKYLNEGESGLDENNNKTINSTVIKTKLNKISKILKNLKSNG